MPLTLEVRSGIRDRAGAGGDVAVLDCSQCLSSDAASSSTRGSLLAIFISSSADTSGSHGTSAQTAPEMS